MPLAPVPVILPLAAALVLLAIERHIPSRLADAVAILVAAATTAIAALLSVQAFDAPAVYWFGGWTPVGDAAIGIGFVIGPAAGIMATFSAFLFTASFLFGWHYFDDVEARFHILMLVFLAAITGFCLTGDLFNLFVFFELMGVAAFAATAYKQEASAIEGSLNFTVINMIGSFLLLGGIAMIYGRTGALNLAQIGRAVGDTKGDALLAMSCALLFAGLLIKGAIMPFHFWLSDAHAVAPTPVCVIFSGIMVSVALFAAARIYWTAFASVDAITIWVKTLLLYLGTITAVIGGCACLMQRHIKRLLAFSTISHLGVMLAGFATLTKGGTAGFLLYLMGHGLVKGALFMIAGILMSAHQSVDEIELRGQGRDLPVTGTCCALGGLLLAGLPFGLMESGRAFIDHAAESAHTWIPYALAFGAALTGAAVLRTTGRVFLGLGPDPGEEAQAPSKKEEEKPRPSRLLLIPVVSFLVLCLVGQTPAAEHLAAQAVAFFTDQGAHAALVLDGNTPHIAAPKLEHSGPALAWGAVALAIVIAGFELSRDKIPMFLGKAIDVAAWPFFMLVDRMHTGHVGDYAAWTMFGLVLFGLGFIW